MKVFIGIVLIVFLALFSSFILYFFLLRQKPKTKRKIKAAAKPKVLSTKSPSLSPSVRSRTLPGNKYELPPEIPRDINTIKIIAEEDPNIIIDIIRKWMRQR